MSGGSAEKLRGWKNASSQKHFNIIWNKEADIVTRKGPESVCRFLCKAVRVKLKLCYNGMSIIGTRYRDKEILNLCLVVLMSKEPVFFLILNEKT